MVILVVFFVIFAKWNFLHKNEGKVWCEKMTIFTVFHFWNKKHRWFLWCFLSRQESPLDEQGQFVKILNYNLLIQEKTCNWILIFRVVWILLSHTVGYSTFLCYTVTIWLIKDASLISWEHCVLKIIGHNLRLFLFTKIIEDARQQHWHEIVLACW